MKGCVSGVVSVWGEGERVGGREGGGVGVLEEV